MRRAILSSCSMRSLSCASGGARVDGNSHRGAAHEQEEEAEHRQRQSDGAQGPSQQGRRPRVQPSSYSLEALLSSTRFYSEPMVLPHRSF